MKNMNEWIIAIANPSEDEIVINKFYGTKKEVKKIIVKITW